MCRDLVELCQRACCPTSYVSMYVSSAGGEHAAGGGSQIVLKAVNCKQQMQFESIR